MLESFVDRAGQPWMLLGKLAPHADQMHDRKNAGALEIILGRRHRIRKQPADLRVATEPGRDARTDESVDLSSFQHARQRAPFRSVIEPHVLRQRDSNFFRPTSFFQSTSDPMYI